MNSSGFGTIIEIGDVLVSEDVVCEFFACDYAACRGACCVEGESGAPLEESELEGLEEGYSSFCGLMTDAGRKRVDEVGFFEVDRDGDLVTPCVTAGGGGAVAAGSAAGSGACAFCHFGGLPEQEPRQKTPKTSDPPAKNVGGPSKSTENDGAISALCAIEMAGRTKPVSCSLYPIRITKMPGGGLALNLHRWTICKPAFEKGRREGIRVYEFLRVPLKRRFGTEFYEALDAAAKHIL